MPSYAENKGVVREASTGDKFEMVNAAYCEDCGETLADGLWHEAAHQLVPLYRREPRECQECLPTFPTVKCEREYGHYTRGIGSRNHYARLSGQVIYWRPEDA